MKAIDDACNKYFQTWSPVMEENIPNPERITIFYDSVREWLDVTETQHRKVHGLIMKALEKIREYRKLHKKSGVHDKFDTTQYGKSKLEVLLSKLQES